MPRGLVARMVCSFTERTDVAGAAQVRRTVPLGEPPERSLAAAPLSQPERAWRRLTPTRSGAWRRAPLLSLETACGYLKWPPVSADREATLGRGLTAIILRLEPVGRRGDAPLRLSGTVPYA